MRCVDHCGLHLPFVVLFVAMDCVPCLLTCCLSLWMVSPVCWCTAFINQVDVFFLAGLMSVSSALMWGAKRFPPFSGLG